MARHLRVEFSGAIYHVTCRMVGDWRTEKTLLFKDDADHERFLDRLAERVVQFNIRLYLFVCMTNHFHLVFETPEANCSKFMQSFSTAYTVYYNLRHGRHGHLLDGRYKAKLVEGDDYLLSLSRYVHLNPVQVGSQKGKPIEERIQALLASESACVTRTRKKDVKEVDVRQFLKAIRLEGDTLHMLLSCTDEGTARPEEVLEVLGCQEGRDYAKGLIERTHVSLSPSR